MKGISQATVVSAVPLSDKNLSQMQSYVEQLLNQSDIQLVRRLIDNQGDRLPGIHIQRPTLNSSHLQLDLLKIIGLMVVGLRPRQLSLRQKCLLRRIDNECDIDRALFAKPKC